MTEYIYVYIYIYTYIHINFAEIYLRPLENENQKVPVDAGENCPR